MNLRSSERLLARPRTDVGEGVDEESVEQNADVALNRFHVVVKLGGYAAYVQNLAWMREKVVENSLCDGLVETFFRKEGVP